MSLNAHVNAIATLGSPLAPVAVAFRHWEGKALELGALTCEMSECVEERGCKVSDSFLLYEVNSELGGQQTRTAEPSGREQNRNCPRRSENR
jgi:hypothetical protein